MLLALCSSAAAQPPRVWFESVPIRQGSPAGGDATPVLEIKLMLEAGSAPVEVHTVAPVMPRLRDAQGKDVVLGDWRAVAGMAPPQPPPPPQPALASGQRHVVCSYTVLRRAAGGYHLMAPYGGADLPAGTYTITAALDLTPTTREMWIAQMRAGAGAQPRRGDRHGAGDTPEQAAGRYAAHWQAVPGFFQGHV